MATPTPDELCSAIAARQFGLITRAQALCAGLTRDGIKVRLCVGRWLRVLPLVYAVAGSPETWEQRAMAAQLWAGPGAALSHLTAAAIWRLRDTRPAVIDVVTNRNVRAAGVRVHRATVAHNDVARSGAFTVTSADRTLIDLASVLNEARLESCLEEALHQRLLDPADLRIRLSSCGSRGRRGAGTLRQLLDMRGPDCAPTESDLETLLLRVLRKARLPAPQRQYEVWNGHEFVARLDFAYPDAHLAIQADSYRWHSRRRAWEKDIHQRNKLQVLGWRLRPTTYGELKYRPELFAKDVAYLLRARHPLGL